MVAKMMMAIASENTRKPSSEAQDWGEGEEVRRWGGGDDEEVRGVKKWGEGWEGKYLECIAKDPETLGEAYRNTAPEDQRDEAGEEN